MAVSRFAIISVGELVKTLSEINNCKENKSETFSDGETISYPCSIESMCETCIHKFAALLEWAEDSEEDKKARAEEPKA